MWKSLSFVSFIVVLGFAVSASSCDGGGTPSTSAQQAAQQKASDHSPYIPKNDIEFNNYNDRMKISDDPTTILWCTTTFGNPSSPLITVPIVGKLTSGTKRPYSTSIVQQYYQNSGSYSPELPGPDGMFGASTAYRYGFTPGGIYVEFSESMPTYCTTEPSVFQRQSTTIALGTDNKLLAAQNAARAELAKCDAKSTPEQQAVCKANAERILEAAIGK